MFSKQFDKVGADRNNLVQISDKVVEISQASLPPKFVRPSAQNRDSQLIKSFNPSQNILQSTNNIKDSMPKHVAPVGHRGVQPVLAYSDQRVDTVKDSRFPEGGQLVPSKPNKELSFDFEDLDIPWSDLVLKERIGAGIFCGCFGEPFVNKIVVNFIEATFSPLKLVMRMLMIIF